MGRKHPVKKWPYKFVEVVWEDIRTKNSWVHTANFVSPSVVHERGWLVHQEDRFIVIAGQLSENDDPDEIANGNEFDMGTHTAIPRGCIVSIKEVRG